MAAIAARLVSASRKADRPNGVTDATNAERRGRGERRRRRSPAVVFADTTRAGELQLVRDLFAALAASTREAPARMSSMPYPSARRRCVRINDGSIERTCHNGDADRQ